jgi:uncharacterized phiE125 gp8 family phage protein
MRVSLVSGPAAEPIDATDADGPVKKTLRITGSTEDAYLTSLVTTARSLIEGEIRRAMVNQVFDQYHDSWPDNFKLARGRVLTLASITFIDEDDASDTFATSNVDLATWEDPLPRVTLKSGQTWPTATLRPHDGIILRYTAGYGTSGTSVPADLKHAVAMATVALYDGCGLGEGPLWKGALALAYKYTVPRIECQ